MAFDPSVRRIGSSSGDLPVSSSVVNLDKMVASAISESDYSRRIQAFVASYEIMPVLQALNRVEINNNNSRILEQYIALVVREPYNARLDVLLACLEGSMRCINPYQGLQVNYAFIQYLCENANVGPEENAQVIQKVLECFKQMEPTNEFAEAHSFGAAFIFLNLSLVLH